MAIGRRPFRIEASSGLQAGAISIDQPDAVAARLEKILNELVELRSAVTTLDRQSQSAEFEFARNIMWQGFESIKGAIDSTKLEIATLHASGNGVKLDRATDELGAVVSDTEAATEEILQAAETIEEAANKLLAGAKANQKALAEEICMQATKIFEACNFQDISGQRIRKVVDLMRFIEERISRMTAIWGGAELTQADGSASEEDEEQALLNGPALASDENVVSQDDIDSFFS